MIRTHVVTTADPLFFLRQSPNRSPILDGVRFSFGLTPPADADVVIVHYKLSASIIARLPRSRTVFFVSEPPDIRSFDKRFLDQFGWVISPYILDTSAKLFLHNYCFPWLAGIDRHPDADPANDYDYDYFSALPLPEGKLPKVSIISGRRSNTEMHKLRDDFISQLVTALPNMVDIYGFNEKQIDRKADALIPYQYHIALENTVESGCWSEKIADSFLCWCYTFYAGCTDIDRDFPERAYLPIDIANPRDSIEKIRTTIENDLWYRSTEEISSARRRILQTMNLMKTLSRISHDVIASEASTEYAYTPLLAERSIASTSATKLNRIIVAIRTHLFYIFPTFEVKLASAARSKRINDIKNKIRSISFYRRFKI